MEKVDPYRESFRIASMYGYIAEILPHSRKVGAKSFAIESREFTGK
jgi:hypothetical protein